MEPSGLQISSIPANVGRNLSVIISCFTHPSFTLYNHGVQIHAFTLIGFLPYNLGESFTAIANARPIQD
jgi:hypothetical protein